MNKDIWHTPPEQPDPFKSWNILVVYEANDRKEMMYSTQFIHTTDGMYVNRWCYLDDLLALETELERTRKALDGAINAIESAKDHNVVNCVTRGKDLSTDDVHITLCKALEQITALEQKD